MRTVVYLPAFLLAAILVCQAHSSPSEKKGWRGWRDTGWRGWRERTYGGDGRVSCLDRRCPKGKACRREIRVTKSPVSRCLPDIRAAIRKRMDIYVKAFNRKDFQTIEDLFAVDAVIAPVNSPLRRGRAGFAEFFAKVAAALKWDKLTWIMDTVAVGTDDFVPTVLRFEITSTVANAPTTFGKCIVVWKRRRGVYEIDMFADNFDAEPKQHSRHRSSIST